MTPGNFLALKTWNTSENIDASTGAAVVLSDVEEFCEPTFTKFIFNLIFVVSIIVSERDGLKMERLC